MSIKFTVGMGTFFDYDRTQFTIMNLLINHSDTVDEVLVIDNDPSSQIGRSLEEFVSHLPKERVRYIPFTEQVGTAPPKNIVFEQARNEYVVAIDSHVIPHKDAFWHLGHFYTENPNCRDLIQGPLLYDNLQSVSTHFTKKWSGGMMGQWDTDPEWKEKRVFPIFAQGAGLLACRKDSWLGFNKRFSGFGGEEGYIQEKYRKNGRQALCLTGLQWWHSFSCAERILRKVPYPLSESDKIRNYVIGFYELEDHYVLLEIKEHFKISDSQWDEWLAVARGDKEFTDAHAVKRNAALLVNVSAESTCKDPQKRCGGVKAMSSIDEWYKKSASTPSDINEHVPKLAELAKGQDVVIEFGVRTGVSTAGLAFGRPKKLISYDKNPSNEVAAMLDVVRKEGVVFNFNIADTLELDMPECDVLFIDTYHTGAHVLKELNRHASKVRKRIAFHDTQIFGYKGEDGGPGLLSGIVTFLKMNREWQVIYHVDNNHGFTVISRDPADFPKVDPFTLRDVARFGKTVLKHKINGGKYLPLDVVENRLNTCLMCPTRSGEQCSKCKCFLFQIPETNAVRAGQPGKIFYPHEVCPLGKWFDQNDKGVEMTEEEIKNMMLTLNKEETSNAN